MRLDKKQPTRVTVTRNRMLVASRMDDFSSRSEIRSWVNQTLRYRFPNKKVEVGVVNGETYIHWMQIVG